ncbi:MAG: dephospho-CoA kinase [Psychromonas sp.]
MTLIIGLTGGIGSGKSTVSKFFHELGIEIVDADIVARQVVERGQPALRKIADHFGDNILIEGELNRKLLRQLIFSNEAHKKWLNDLLHPLIRKQMIKQLSEVGGDYAIFEAPLLFENKLESMTDFNLVIDVSVELQIERASKRDDASEEGIKAVINSQISRSSRLQKADYCIDNSVLSIAQLQNQVIVLDRQFRQLKKY